MDETILDKDELIPLPGFRFHLTEQELVCYYLKNIILGHQNSCSEHIGFLNIYLHQPWNLPEREWYFFVPRERENNGRGGRSNRTTKHGFWKATGSERPIQCVKDYKTTVGYRKTFVFYNGRAPSGSRTDWVMNEYRLPTDSSSSPKERIVLSKIYKKATSVRVLEQRAAMEDEHNQKLVKFSNLPSLLGQADHTLSQLKNVENKEEKEHHGNYNSATTLQVESIIETTMEFQVPRLVIDYNADLLDFQMTSLLFNDHWPAFM